MSKTTSEKTTIYLDPNVKKGIQLYAIRDNTSLSAIINNQLNEYIEDQADRVALNDRQNNTQFIPFEQALKELGLSEKDL